MREEFGDDYLIINGAIFLSEIKTYLLRSCLCVISIIGTESKLTIEDWYSSSSNHIESFKSKDGKILLDSQVQNLVNAMASLTPPAAGQTTLPQSYQDQLAPVLAANWK